MDSRLPAHVEVSGLVRMVNASGGFGTVVSTGERDAGTILVIFLQQGKNAWIYERMPCLDGTRKWACSKSYDPEKPFEFQDYIERRKRQDPDLWVVELDSQNPEQFVSQLAGGG